jgi:hypothetical protein
MSSNRKPPKVLRDFVYDRRDLVLKAVQTTDQVVARQKGVTGLAVRAAYKMTRGLAPNMMEEIVDGFLDEFLDALTPFYHEALERNVPLDEYMVNQKHRVAEALVNITDQRERAETKATALKSGYRSLRPQAIARMEDACPELGKLMQDNIPREFRPGERNNDGGMYAAAT